MKTKSLVEMLETVDATYISEHEKAAAIARAESAEFTVEMISSAFAWVKKTLVSKRISFNSAKHSHA
ncbi:hypothetical protein [Marinomonas ostreistagni]|uniref:Uncharacterized protein n=1 Tax=Marinomonas ostreistagni TaxID=359209 RepID=A0ABS0ZC77_9GAMM|nr:hypothetical protein [Marinomonas ostreistagni]MBJ7551261.1 hypothetical protein [Marinomonas ostreistagni]